MSAGAKSRDNDGVQVSTGGAMRTPKKLATTFLTTTLAVFGTLDNFYSNRGAAYHLGIIFFLF